MHYKNYTDEDVIKATAESTNIRQVLMKLGLSPKGGNYATFQRHKERLNLDTSHFGHYTDGLVPFERQPLEELMVENSTTDGSWIRYRLLDENIRPHQCEHCGRTTWEDYPIPLEIHHINGKSFDHRAENVLLLCPNCHYFTDNFRGRNISKS